MTRPRRIQRRRTRGWKIPENTKYVGRPSRWGNPYPAYVWGQQESVDRFAEILADPYKETVQGFREHMLHLRAGLKELRGKNLACWCPPERPCHADVLLKMANR